MDIGYARVSRNDQILDRQIDELEAAGCERVFTEKASGSKESKRPEFDLCLRTLRTGDRLVVTELSRLGRHMGELANLSEQLKKLGVGLRILNFGIDTSSPSGAFFFNIIAAVAQMERELLIERTRSGLAAARAQGRVGGRKRSITAKQLAKAQALYDEHRFTMAEIARVCETSPATLYRYLEIEGGK
ncbi:recombinase family protein [Zhihengliuella sp.]|uniref:recombinase family protein n=1 Tax=Zhihengliuella sp. TaxID=1954483 RepID=UPI0028115712|nr:recombinase family protein [Zhihengliuella sp.]